MSQMWRSSLLFMSYLVPREEITLVEGGEENSHSPNANIALKRPEKVHVHKAHRFGFRWFQA